MIAPELALQKAIIGALKADAALMRLVKGVHDHVPEAAPMPYVAYGPDDVAQNDSDCLAGYELFVRLDV